MVEEQFDQAFDGLRSDRMNTIETPELKTDQPLRVLIIEDTESDVNLLLLALRDGGFEVTYEAVATEAAMRAALQSHPWT
jgi:hypothetical protein